MIPQHDNSAESNCILDQTASQRFFGYALNSWAYPSRAAYMVMLIVLVAFLLYSLYTAVRWNYQIFKKLQLTGKYCTLLNGHKKGKSD